MKIILEGTEAEFINALNSFSIPNKVVFDNGSQFFCGNMCGRRCRNKKADQCISGMELSDRFSEYLTSSDNHKKSEEKKAEIIRQFRNLLDIALSTQHDVSR